MNHKSTSSSKLPEQREERFSQTPRTQIFAVATAIAVVFVIVYIVFAERKPRPPEKTATEPLAAVPEQPDLSITYPAVKPFVFVPRQPNLFTTPIPDSTLPPNTSLTPPFHESKYPFSQYSQELVYNVINPVQLIPSQKLQKIVDDVVNLAKRERLPPQSLSVTLIDAKSRETAGYQENELRYPASIVKLFWMVVLYGQLQAKTDHYEGSFVEDLERMIRESNNDSASRILDNITGTESGHKLNEEDFKTWLNKRQFVNRFFQIAGYEEINLSQKTHPILYLKLDEPKGRDLQMRGDPAKPIRNRMTTQQAARLMYEIATRQAISPMASEQMEHLLLRDLEPEAWQDIDPNLGDFNPIQAFLGEYLPKDTYFVSKAGWTANSRQEVAFIRTKDDRATYILAIFADSRAYAQNWTIFPKMSRLVYDRMTVINSDDQY